MANVIDESNFMQLFVELLKDKDYYVAQSKFALIGIIIIIIIIIIIDCLDTCNNAMWAIGEIIVAYSSEKFANEPPAFLSPYLEEILTYSFHIIGLEDVDDIEGKI